MLRRKRLLAGGLLLLAILMVGALVAQPLGSRSTASKAAPSLDRPTGSHAASVPNLPSTAQSNQSGAIYRGVSTAVQFDVSPPLSSIVPQAAKSGTLRDNDDDAIPAASNRPADADTVLQKIKGVFEIPTPVVSFDGPPNLAGVAPPDPNGEVGPNHVVVMDNLSFQIFNKTGTSLFGPAANNTLWAGFGGPCQTENAGDPVVLYDQLADRWLLSQFTSAGPTYYNCVALSTTGNPTGTYYRWAFTTGTNFPDYPKYGMWPDAYYISTREFDASNNFMGVGAYAPNRVQMLAGNPSPQMVSFLAPPTPLYNVGDGLLPSDLDGTTLPPAGSPNYFVGTMDNNGGYGAPQDAITFWKFHVDYITPSNSSFTLANTLPTAPFNSAFPCSGRNCIPQPGTTNKLDILSYRQRPTFRLAYRNMGTYESLVTNQSVDAGTGPGGDVAGIRWYELRSPSTTPVIFQQGTYAPGLTDGIHRWMGSIAMDGAGNMAMGYSASNSTVFPSIYYTGRLVTDPPGQMPQGEAAIVNGTGSQTGAQRWGDYTDTTVDPVDDCTFWHVNEYVPTTSSAGWRLRIGAFRLPGCGSGAGTATPTATTGAATATRTVTPSATATVVATCTPGWTTGAPFPTTIVRSVGVWFPTTNRFYVVGGRTSDAAGSGLQNPYEYNPSTDTWTMKSASFSGDDNLSNMDGAVLTGPSGPRVYLVGGSAGGGTTSIPDVRVYDPVADTITTLATDPWPAPINTLPGGQAVFNNKLYILGGYVINPAGMSNQIWEFDPNRAAGARWALKSATLPAARGYVPATTIGNYIYTAGGSDYVGGTLVDSVNTYRYDPVADTIDDASIPELPAPGTAETRALNVNGEMWVMGGGRTAPNPSNVVYRWTPGQTSWTTGPNFVNARRNFPVDVQPGVAIYMTGGYVNSTPSNSTEIYRISCATPTPATTATSTRTASPTATAGTPGPTCTPIVFSDVLPTDYFYTAVQYLACHGAISGYADGTFRPYNDTTRGQLTKIVVLAEGFPFNTTGGPHFTDVTTSNPFYVFIETAYNRGLISGYADGTFRWGANVTRAQLSKIIVLAEGWALDTTGGPHFTDVPTTNPFYVYVETAFNHGIISGYSDGTFRPNNNATRGQISVIVYRAITAP